MRGDGASRQNQTLFHICISEFFNYSHLKHRDFSRFLAPNLNSLKKYEFLKRLLFCYFYVSSFAKNQSWNGVSEKHMRKSKRLFCPCLLNLCYMRFSTMYVDIDDFFSNLWEINCNLFNKFLNWFRNGHTIDSLHNFWKFYKKNFQHTIYITCSFF